MVDHSFSDEFWPALQEQAINAVRRGYEPEHVSGYTDRLELQLLTLPAFGPVVSWQVYCQQPRVYEKHPTENGGQPRFIATRTTWAQQADMEKFFSPMKRLEYLNRLSPSLSFQTVEIDALDVQNGLERLHKLVLPLFTENHPGGLDGVQYEISTRDYFVGARLRWWGEGPEEWRPLIDIFTSLWAMLEK